MEMPPGVAVAILTGAGNRIIETTVQAPTVPAKTAAARNKDHLNFMFCDPCPPLWLNLSLEPIFDHFAMVLEFTVHPMIRVIPNAAREIRGNETIA